MCYINNEIAVSATVEFPLWLHELSLDPVHIQSQLFGSH